jgi:hypothetical protein
MLIKFIFSIITYSIYFIYYIYYLLYLIIPDPPTPLQKYNIRDFLWSSFFTNFFVIGQSHVSKVRSHIYFRPAFFTYNDSHMKHSTIYNPSRLLFQIS